MPLNELLPAVSQLSHQDKLRLIHFLLLAVAREEGCDLELTDDKEPEALLLKQLASTEAVVWSPYEAYEAAQTLSELLEAARHEDHADGKRFPFIERSNSLGVSSTMPYLPLTLTYKNRSLG